MRLFLYLTAHKAALEKSHAESEKRRKAQWKHDHPTDLREIFKRWSKARHGQDKYVYEQYGFNKQIAHTFAEFGELGGLVDTVPCKLCGLNRLID